MYVVQEYFDNGTTRMYGPMFRESTAQKFQAKIAKPPVESNNEIAIRKLTPWRSYLKRITKEKGDLNG